MPYWICNSEFNYPDLEYAVFVETGEINRMAQDYHYEDRNLLSSSMVQVLLWRTLKAGLCLLVGSKTGVVYFNQTGGIACTHPGYQGYAIPIVFDDDNHLVTQLRNMVVDKSATMIDALDANAIDMILYKARELLPYDLMIDRERLEDCEEAWLHVSWIDRGGCVNRGVLTWQNTD